MDISDERKVANYKANRIINALGIEKSLERRYATIDEIPKIWFPTPSKAIKDAMAKTAKQKIRIIPTIPKNATKISWCDFQRNVLPLAYKLEYFVTDEDRNYGAIHTASYYDAPPIFEWDSIEDRNPVSWYQVRGGSSPKRWNLPLGFCKVTAISDIPLKLKEIYMKKFTKEDAHTMNAVIFTLLNARDLQYKDVGSVFFDEILADDLFKYRNEIQLISQDKIISGIETSPWTASASGIFFPSSSRNGVTSDSVFQPDFILRVTNAKAKTFIYNLKSWE